MSFKTDKQTISDLELFSNRKDRPSIFSCYSNTVTYGGRELLRQIFNGPSSDFEFLTNRIGEIRFFIENDCRLKLNSRSIEYIEYYLTIRRIPLRANLIDATVNALSNRFTPDNDYFVISESIIHITQLLLDLKEFIDSTKSFNPSATFKSHLDEILDFISSKTISSLIKKPPEKTKDLSNNQINKFDNHFRVKEKEAFRNLLTIVYEIDFLQTMSQLVISNGYSLPKFVKESELVFETSDAFHPFLDQPVKNSFNFNSNSSLCFLTGPNMSGKSTFLKTMGLLTYLAHLGLPVPAKEFKTSVFNGLFSTINLSDDLNLGYSHFYSEVNRVKEIANLLSSDKNLVIIFDELFRGTNVKDAYDASLKVISSLNKVLSSFFFISTHILEVAENIDNKESITFKCFESDLIDNMPVYDYKLKVGISKERVGMRILEKENVIKILDELIKRQNK